VLGLCCVLFSMNQFPGFCLLKIENRILKMDHIVVFVI